MAEQVFYGLAILTIGSAIFALESRELIYGAIGLALSMLGIAGFFILLDAPFVAMFQIAVYVGAVAVLVIFTVMLVRTNELFTKREDKNRRIAGIVFAFIFMIVIGLILLGSELSKASIGELKIDNITQKIGGEMLTYYSPAFILLALVLAGSIIGALTLARREDVDNSYERVN
ncbi:MAG: hypothetical protein DA328_01255 [Nitrososphaeraceae archaeon]|nr:hypothetical protein [Nitrososphaeraceae archaeon]